MKRKLCLSSLVILILLLPPFLQQSSYSYLIHILSLMGLMMILGLGVNFVVGFLGLLDLGFMAFYAIGAYTMAILSLHGFNFWVSLLGAVAASMGVRSLVGAPVMRLRGDYLAIVTLGFGEITRLVLNNWDSVTRGPKGISLLTEPLVKPIMFFSFELSTSTHFYYLIFIFVLLGILMSVRLNNSRIGRAWTAIREDGVAAQLTGVQVTRMKMIGFVASALFAGLAGGLFARVENFVTPESFTFFESVMLVAMVVIGGMGSVTGTLMGVALVVLVPELLRNILGSPFVSWRYLLFGLTLVVMAVLRPQGLWPSSRITRELGLDQNK